MSMTMDENVLTSDMHLSKSFLEQGLASLAKTKPTTDDIITLSSDDDADLVDIPFVMQPKPAAQKSGSTFDDSCADNASTGPTEDNAKAKFDGSGCGEPQKEKEAEFTYTLDMLLDDRKQQNDEKKELAEMDTELTEFLRQGGVAKLSLNTSEDDLTPEHKAQIKKLEVSQERITRRPPGVDIFLASRASRLFAFPHTLTLASCGFVPGPSLIDQRLASLTTAMQLQMVASGIVKLCLPSMNTGNAVLRWAFLLLSDISTPMELSQLSYLLTDILHMKSSKCSDWVPSVIDFVRILVNFGAEFKDICSHPELLSFNEDQLWMTNDVDSTNGHCKGPEVRPDMQRCVNFQYVLRILTEALVNRPTHYTVNDLKALMLVLLKALLDVNFMQDTLLLADFTAALSALLTAFPDDHWRDRVAELCVPAANLVTHHHNAVRIVDVLPPGERGHHFQRRLSYALLDRLVFQHDSSLQSLTQLQVRNLFSVMRQLLSWENSDFYFISSVVKLLDYCIGSERLKTAEKGDFQMLINMLRRVMGNVRESITLLDRSTVKDMMIQLTNQWSYMLLDMGPKQKSLFAWNSQHPRRMPIERVQSCQIDFDQSDDGGVESNHEAEAPIDNDDDRKASTAVQTNNQLDIQADAQIDKEPDVQTEVETGLEMDIEADVQMNVHTEREMALRCC